MSPAFSDVFTTRRDGYRMFRCPSVCVTARGTVLCAGEARNTDTDWGQTDVLLRRSTDGGRTWGASARVSQWDQPVERDPFQKRHANADKPGTTFSNIVLITGVGSRVHLLYCVEYRYVAHRISDDDGLTWGPVRNITGALETLRAEYPWRVAATGPGHGIRLRSGRLVVPVWMARGSDGPGGDHRPSQVTTLVSDDGSAWKAGGWVAKEKAPGLNPSESQVAQLPDGRVLMNIRSESPEHRRLHSFSPDGATNWSVPRWVPDLPEPVCNAGLICVGDRMYFSNPSPPEVLHPAPKGKFLPRNTLTVRSSRDGGETWPLSRVLDGGNVGYSDLGALADGTLLCFYERTENAKKPRAFDTLTLARFDHAWVEGVA